MTAALHQPTAQVLQLIQALNRRPGWTSIRDLAAYARITPELTGSIVDELLRHRLVVLRDGTPPTVIWGPAWDLWGGAVLTMLRHELELARWALRLACGENGLALGEEPQMPAVTLELADEDGHQHAATWAVLSLCAAVLEERRTIRLRELADITGLHRQTVGAMVPELAAHHWLRVRSLGPRAEGWLIGPGIALLVQARGRQMLLPFERAQKRADSALDNLNID